MIITYKDFRIEKDLLSYKLSKLVSYEKRESLHGPVTGEIGEKEDIIGYYGNLNNLLAKLPEFCIDSEEPMTLTDFLKQIIENQKEIKNLIK